MPSIFEEKTNSVGGLGLAQNPPSVNIPDLKIPQIGQGSAPAQPQQKPKSAFKQNPLLAIGTLLSSIAAGMQGQPSPALELQERREKMAALQAQLYAQSIEMAGSAAEAINKLPPEQAEQAKTLYGSAIESINGAPPGFGAQAIDIFSQSSNIGKDIAYMSGLTDVIVDVGGENFSGQQWKDLASNKDGILDQLAQLADRKHAAAAQSKLEQAHEFVKKLAKSQNVARFPEAQGALKSFVDPLGRFQGTPDQYLEIVRSANGPDGNPLFDRSELAYLERHPEVLEAVTGAKTAEKQIKEREAVPLTETGKLQADLERFQNQFGAGSPQARAIQDTIREQGISGPAQRTEARIDNESSMRAQFTASSRDFLAVRDAFKKIKVMAVGEPSAAGDLSLIFGYMKLLDADSSVREGEQATAENATGVPQVIRNLYNKLLTGEKLNPEQRKDFLNRANQAFATHLESQRALEKEYARIAKDSGLNPRSVVVDYVGNIEDEPQKIALPPGIPDGSVEIEPDANGNRQFMGRDGLIRALEPIP